ncbi:uncharacterized protein LOC101752919 isoform X1 [Setaria italica]|nr:uncharacterized protein LOC101752919 isoform X1 [Setaria italica]
MALAAIYSLFIINKSGGLIYYKQGGWTPMTVLDWQVFGIQCTLSPSSSPLSLAVQALTSYKPTTSISTASNLSQIIMIPAFPIWAMVVCLQSLGTGKHGYTTCCYQAQLRSYVIDYSASYCHMHLCCYRSALIASGTKIFVVCETGAQNMETLLKVIYELYTDFVLKNPFYEMEMPIRCELFDLNLAQVIQKDRVALLGR